MKPKILVVGDVMLDKFTYGEVKRISPEAPIPILLEGETNCYLGGAGNVAANASALGADVDLCGVIGEDAESEKVIQLLHNFGVGWLMGIRFHGKTTTKTRYCSSTHSGHHLLRLDHEDCGLKHSSVFESSFGEIGLSPYDAIIICDYLKGVVTQGVVDYIENNFSKKVFFDGKPSSPTPPENWVWKLNQQEAEQTFGFPSPQENLPLMCEECLITCGRGGIYAYSDADSIAHHPALCKSPVDVSGAGDAVTAAYAVARTQGKSIPEALEFASKAAAFAVSQKGTTVVRLEDIQ